MTISQQLPDLRLQALLDHLASLGPLGQPQLLQHRVVAKIESLCDPPCELV